MKIKEAISRGLLTESEAKNIPVITRAELDVIIKESKKNGIVLKQVFQEIIDMYEVYYSPKIDN